MQLKTAADQAEGWPGLRALRQAALDLSERAHESDAIRKQADTFSRDADPMRFHLLGFGGDAASASLDLEAALAPFGVLQDANWFRRDRLGRLDEPRRDRLIEEVNELLFIWLFAVGRDRQGDREMGAVPSGSATGRWSSSSRAPPGTTCATGGAVRWANSRAPTAPRKVTGENSARACFQWGLLAVLEHDRRQALAWLGRARFLRPDNYWHQYALAYQLERAGDVDGALVHYEASIALRPDAPWARYNRAHLSAIRHEWLPALRDLDIAVTSASDIPMDGARFRIERGKIRQAIGDVLGARADFEAALAVAPSGRIARDARIDRARLFAETGALRSGASRI